MSSYVDGLVRNGQYRSDREGWNGQGEKRCGSQRILTIVNSAAFQIFISLPFEDLPDCFMIFFGSVDAVHFHECVNDVDDRDVGGVEYGEFTIDKSFEVAPDCRDEGFFAIFAEEVVLIGVHTFESRHGYRE